MQILRNDFPIARKTNSFALLFRLSHKITNGAAPDDLFILHRIWIASPIDYFAVVFENHITERPVFALVTHWDRWFDDDYRLRVNAEISRFCALVTGTQMCEQLKG